MTYLHSIALQRAIYDRLLGFEPLKALIGKAIYDRLPSGTQPQAFVLIGDERVLDRSDKSAHASRHDLTISVIGQEQGFANIKAIAAQIVAALDGADLSLSDGMLRQMQFQNARAGRNIGRFARRIDIIFRALIDET